MKPEPGAELDITARCASSLLLAYAFPTALEFAGSIVLSLIYFAQSLAFLRARARKQKVYGLLVIDQPLTAVIIYSTPLIVPVG